MTTRPRPMDFAQPELALAPQGTTLRPKVSERFWGYEVSANVDVVDFAVMMRALCGFLAVASFLASLGIWVMPAMAFVAPAFTSKAVTSVLLMCMALILARVAARGTRVRVQIDTAKGELREVVTGPLGADMILSQYGLDAVRSIEIVSSRTIASFGQVLIHIEGVGAVPAGVGASVFLGPLRERLAADCGLQEFGPAREAVWSGGVSS